MVKLRKMSINSVKNKKVKTASLFTIINDNMDVRINRDIGGKWKGFTFSQLMDDYEGRRLLFWISNQDFNKRVVELAKEMVEA